MQSKSHLILHMVLLMAFFLIGCSSLIKPVKPQGNTIDKTSTDISPLRTDRSMMESSPFKFPVSDDISNLCSFQQGAYRHFLIRPIRYYRRVMGTYPDSMDSYVRSGFPLHWPRNVLTGAPVSVLDGRNFKMDRSDLGMIKWEKFSDDHAKLSFVDLDYSTYSKDGVEIWVEKTIEFKWRKREESKLDDYRQIELHPADNEQSIDIIGGTKPINDVSSKEIRMIYGMCGQIADQVYRSSGKVISPERTIDFVLPTSFREFYNESNMIILENFANFSKLMNNSGADFITGIDYNKNAQYSWLKMGDETLIVLCRILNPNSENNAESQYIGIQYGDEIGVNLDPDFSGFKSMADMSSPMITGNNLNQIEIPSDIIISIENILL